MAYQFRPLFLVTVLLVMTSLAAISFSAVGCGSDQGEGDISSDNETQASSANGQPDQGDEGDISTDNETQASSANGQPDQGKESGPFTGNVILPPMPDPIIVNPKLEGPLSALIEAEERGEAESFASTNPRIDLVDGKVVVNIVCAVDQVDAATEAASRFGGTVTVISSYHSPNLRTLGALIPITSLIPLSEEPSIRIIRLPVKPVPGGP